MGTQSHYLVFPPSFGEPLISIGLTSDRPFSLPSDPSSGAAFHIRNISRKRPKNQKTLRDQGESHGHATAIGVLPDDVLLEIFDLCQIESPFQCRPVWRWHFLVHVCRRWRQIVFESPRRLNLKILCTHGTPAKKNLDIWPSFPIVIHYGHFARGISPNDEGNIITVLKRHDRVCSVTLIGVTGSQLGNMATVMQEPFPVLTRLYISVARSDLGNATVLPAKFLGGSAPCLQNFTLTDIPYPALPTLLLSASDLVSLSLRDIPPTGYISPKEVAVSLAALPRLERFVMESQWRRSGYQIHSPPLVLPSLTYFRFSGANEYLEDLVTQIEAPQLYEICIYHSNLLVPQLHMFTYRSVGLKLTLFSHARVIFRYDNVTFEIRMKSHLHTSASSSDRPFVYTIECEGQLSHFTRVVSHFLAKISAFVHVHLVHVHLETIEHRSLPVDWLDFLLAISTVQTLYVEGLLTSPIALTLQGITEWMAPIVLPSLHLICFGYYYSLSKPGPSIEKFVSARKLCGRPVTVLGYLEFKKRVESYVYKSMSHTIEDATHADEYI